MLGEDYKVMNGFPIARPHDISSYCCFLPNHSVGPTCNMVLWLLANEISRTAAELQGRHRDGRLEMKNNLADHTVCDGVEILLRLMWWCSLPPVPDFRMMPWGHSFLHNFLRWSRRRLLFCELRVIFEKWALHVVWISHLQHNAKLCWIGEARTP